MITALFSLIVCFAMIMFVMWLVWRLLVFVGKVTISILGLTISVLPFLILVGLVLFVLSCFYVIA
jgi:hypothetical protein